MIYSSRLHTSLVCELPSLRIVAWELPGLRHVVWELPRPIVVWELPRLLLVSELPRLLGLHVPLIVDQLHVCLILDHLHASSLISISSSARQTWHANALLSASGNGFSSSSNLKNSPPNTDLRIKDLSSMSKRIFSHSFLHPACFVTEHLLKLHKCME